MVAATADTIAVAKVKGVAESSGAGADRSRHIFFYDLTVGVAYVSLSG